MWGILEDEVNKRAEHCRLGVGSTTKRSAEKYSWEGDEEGKSGVSIRENKKQQEKLQLGVCLEGAGSELPGLWQRG